MFADTWGATAETARNAGLRDWIKAAAESQRGRTMLWAPFALTIGIWCYFGLAREPVWPFLSPLAAAAAILFWMSRSRPVLALVALVIAGCLLANAKVHFALVRPRPGRGYHGAREAGERPWVIEPERRKDKYVKP